MKRSFFLIIFILFVGCADVETSNICSPNPCGEQNKTVCKPLGESYICSCDPGYHDEGGACISNSANLCSPNPCTELNRTVCTESNGMVICSCDLGFHLEAEGCVSDIKTVPCISRDQSEIPENGHQVVEDIQISYSNGNWPSAPKCVIECDSGYSYSDQECLNSKTVQCKLLSDETIPENAHQVIADVEIVYSDETGWSEPDFCSWECDDGYFSNGDICGNEGRVVDCTNILPQNAYWGDENLNGQLSQVWDSESELYLPSSDSCVWECDQNYHKDGMECVSDTKEVRCTNSLPENAHWSDQNSGGVLIQSWNFGTAQYEPSPDSCVWECDENYFSNGTVCGLEGRVVACTNSLPENAQWGVENSGGEVSQLYNPETDQYEPSPDSCVWNCVDSYHEQNSRCESDRNVVTCSNSLPQNATWDSSNENGQLIQNWNPDTTQYEPLADSCIWSCNEGFERVGDSCETDVQTVSCTNNLPQNAQWSDQNLGGMINQVYNPNTGEYEPSADSCVWECLSSHHLYNENCEPNYQTVECTNSYPTNSHWSNINGSGNITQSWNFDTEQYEPSADSCVWECNTNYISENGTTCINSKTVSCLPINPPDNGVQIDQNVTITYTTASGWSTAAECSWECITDYISEDGVSCINTKIVSCNTITPPTNGSLIESDVEVYYSTSSGWSSPDDCEWECNTGYHKEGDSCVENSVCTDIFEDNNQVIDSAEIFDANTIERQHTDLYMCTGDTDWYKILGEAGSGLEVDINYNHVTGCDLDMVIYGSIEDAEAEIDELDSSVAVSGRETVYIREAESKYYYIKIYAYEDSCEDAYNLTANIFNSCIDDEDSYGYEHNDSFEEAQSLSLNSVYSRQICDYDDDWYRYSFSAGEKVKAELYFSSDQGDLDLYLYDGDEASVGYSLSVDDNEEIIETIETDGYHYFKIKGYDGAQNNYDFIVNRVVTYDNYSINSSIVDNGCITFEYDLSDQIISSGTINGVNIKKLAIDHEWISDLVIKISFGGGAQETIWDRAGGETDNSVDDDIEDDGDIELINRYYTGLYGESTGDGIFRVEICDELSVFSGVLNELDIDVTYE